MKLFKFLFGDTCFHNYEVYGKADPSNNACVNIYLCCTKCGHVKVFTNKENE